MWVGCEGKRPSISIHALRKESDGKPTLPTTVTIISIHALRKESDFTVA